MLLNVVAIFSTALLSLAFADSSSSTTTSISSSSSTSTAAVATHTVAVGADGFNFYPNQIYANVHDIIEYDFYPLNHSVVRAAFGSTPCIPYEWVVHGGVGFFSGFMPVSLVLPDPPKFTIEVNDTEPIFFYCSAPGACFEGMIGVINANSTQTFAEQFAYSQNTTEGFSPGQSFLPETLAPVRTTTYTGATADPTAPPATTSTTPAAAPVASKSSSLPTGAIVGIAIGGFALLVLGAALLYMCGRQKTVKEILRQSTIAAPNHNSYQPASPGLSEANYPNMRKSPNMEVIGNPQHFSSQSYYAPPAPPTERSMSPPVCERTGMMGMHPMHAGGGQGYPSPGLMSPNSAGYPSPVYADRPLHEMGIPQVAADGGVRPYNPTEPTVHELAAPSRNPSTNNDEHRPFSYTDSESGYARPRDEKSETGTY